MKVAIVASNYIPINKKSHKGTEIWIYRFLTGLKKYIKETNENLQITLFATGNSSRLFPLESVTRVATTQDKYIGKKAHIYFELALLSKAFSQQEKFDLYHINFAAGETALPFARFVKKPILITPHKILTKPYFNKLFSIYKDLKNVFYIPISRRQSEFLTFPQKLPPILHGVETEIYKFDPIGGEKIVFAGRAVPEKGIDIVFKVVDHFRQKAEISAIRKFEHLEWFLKIKERYKHLIKQKLLKISYEKPEKENIIPLLQKAKLLLFPIRYEEPFGMIMIEAMSCGTPVVAFARGSVPEVVKDGETGFIINPSKNDIRGNFVIKKTGIAGLIEAVKRIYTMPKDKYLQMRKSARKHVEKHFTIERMVRDYINTYKKIIKKFS